MSIFGDAAKKIAALTQEIIETKVRFEGLDKEVHRMITLIERTVEKNDSRQDELMRRVVALEAKFEGALVTAATELMKKEMRRTIDQALKEEGRVLDGGPSTEAPVAPAQLPQRGSKSSKRRL